MPGLNAFPAPARCGACHEEPPTVVLLLARKTVLHVCERCAHALIAGEFVYGRPLQAAHGALREPPRVLR